MAQLLVIGLTWLKGTDMSSAWVIRIRACQGPSEPVTCLDPRSHSIEQSEQGVWTT